eukprot:8219419-Pyramimonas_sp.AAC.1
MRSDPIGSTPPGPLRAAIRSVQHRQDLSAQRSDWFNTARTSPRCDPIGSTPPGPLRAAIRLVQPRQDLSALRSDWFNTARTSPRCGGGVVV